MIKKNPYLLNLLILLTLIALAACGDNGLEGEEIAPPDASSTELDSPSIAQHHQ